MKWFWKKMLLFAGCFVLFIMTAVTVFTILSKIEDAASNPKPPSVISPAAPASITFDDKPASRINILLLGIDDGDPDIANGAKRSDTMIVASVDPGEDTVNLLSIPRDTKVSIPGRSGNDKITHAFFYGGPKLSVRAVEANFHIPIDYYAVIDWKAFINVVDILGGVDMTVERDMDYEDPYENLSIHLSQGYQHLDGEKAGEYVRFRHDELGDIGRVERQQRFLTALTGQMLRAGTILKLPALVTTVSQYVQTDMSTFTLIRVANALKGIKSDSLHAEMLPGDFATVNESSYWVPDKAKAAQLVAELFGARAERSN
ncbi:MAG TPA: LCP family protein [Methylomusa anaerophila]|uniref:Putative transcriptional regulator YvhJ n=1 Tax=Methylomusa anaerophila TaxID=1930071 RepID=A0A348ALM1_9FIRM|nr:LCP family protein [Methylomusa anaerophila]BBB91969.1 putative transcriptional regulator YvhJ [Methylomusa anaerophila]HML88019.1 LCP family protein [Methylomusa anaerophila]